MRAKRISFLYGLATVTLVGGGILLEPLASGRIVTGTSGVDPHVPLPNRSELAEQVRNCELTSAERLAQPGTENDGLSAADRSLILGLAAHKCDEFSSALEFLRNAPAEGPYGDWRLFGIARSAIELGQYPAAAAALARIRDEYSDSPLFAKALVASSDLAAARGDLQGVAEIARRSRALPIASDIREPLEVAAWQAGVELDDESVRREVAKQLLVELPLVASELQVIEEFRAEDGSIDWLEFLSPDQLATRAKSLLGAGLRDSALETLESVPPDRRTRHWNLVAAQALTASERGREALAILEQVPTSTDSERSERQWRLAFAALEAAVPRPGRTLNALQREMMRARAHEHLESVISLGTDRSRSKRALRILFEDALESDRFELALETLGRLKAVDPRDTSGASHLWQRGWKQYMARNYSGAIGYWTELSALYPTSSYNRSGLYWSARAHEVLGNPARSQELLERVADVPFNDFYRRHALRRLGDDAPPEIAEDISPQEPWPVDPRLNRSQWLADLGLDSFALTELRALAETTELGASKALEAEILSATGERRNSIIAIKKVYPLLGTPHQGVAPERARRLYYPLAFEKIIERHAGENGLDRNLILAMVRQESAFDPSAKSWAGAHGLMQVMPATGKEIARRLGLSYSRARLTDPAFSIQLGTTYYRQVRSMFTSDELALAGYNAGPYRIKRLWRQAGQNAEFDRFLETLSLQETRSYVKRVVLFADSYSRLYPAARAEAG